MLEPHPKLFIGQYFIYTLRVMDYYLRRVAADPVFANSRAEMSLEVDLGSLNAVAPVEPASAEAMNIHDQKWLSHVEDLLREHKAVRDGVVPPRMSNGSLFSSVNLGEMMGVNSATLNHYLQIFAHKYDYYYQSGLVKGHGANAPQVACQHARDAMARTPYRAIDKTITDKLGYLVRFAIKDSGFFKGLDMFYYLFFRWHRIDYPHLEQVEFAHRNELMAVLRQLEERRLSVDAHEVSGLLDEYFEYYAQFISDPEVINALDYSYYSCYRCNSPEVTRRLLIDLWAVHRAFYRWKGDSGRDAANAKDAVGAKDAPRYGKHLVEQPCVPGGDIWAVSFENAFPSVIERSERTNQALRRLRSWSRVKGVPFNAKDFKKTRLLLETANMTPFAPATDAVHYNSNIHYYDAVDESHFVSFDGLEFALPYYPLIDSTREAPWHQADFAFQADPHHTVRPLEVGPFKPLLETLAIESRHKAINAGYAGVSEYKIYLYEASVMTDGAGPDADSQARTNPSANSPARTNPGADSQAQARANPSAASQAQARAQEDSGTASRPRFVFEAGKSDYFTGIARKDLFASFLVPSAGNLRSPLVYLLDKGLLPKFILHKDARRLQRLYDDFALQNTPGNVRLAKLFAKEEKENEKKVSERAAANALTFEQNITRLLSYEINRLYTEIVASSARRDEDGSLHFLDNGSFYTGCGTFVLTADTDKDGNDRPLLLLEKRWKVSEENDNLSYPSGASCDFYSPLDNVPPEREDIRELEADPFRTAARELREELNIRAQPDELTLISFGIDVNRNLQQFSFLYESPQTAEVILERKRYSATPREGFTFTLPFDRGVILDILNNYHIEAGAVYSLMRLMDLRASRLWPVKTKGEA